jgi:hypothetical protein
VLRAEQLPVSGGGAALGGGRLRLDCELGLRLHQTTSRLMSAEATTDVGVMVEAQAVLHAGGGWCGFNALQAQPCGVLVQKRAASGRRL